MKTQKWLAGAAGLALAIAPLCAHADAAATTPTTPTTTTTTPATTTPPATAPTPKHHKERPYDPARQAAREVEHLEMVTGLTLTADQKTQVEQAVQTWHDATVATETQYYQSLATTANVTVEDLRAKLAAAPKLSPTPKGEKPARHKDSDIVIINMQTALNINLTDAQKQAVTDAVKAHNVATRTDRQTYDDAVAKAVNLTAPELREKEKEYKAAHPGPAHNK